MPYLSGYWVWGRIRICPRRAVSDSAFCAGVECTDQRKNLLGNPSEAEKFPEPPPYVPTRMPYEGPHMLQKKVAGTPFSVPTRWFRILLSISIANSLSVAGRRVIPRWPLHSLRTLAFEDLNADSFIFFNRQG